MLVMMTTLRRDPVTRRTKSRRRRVSRQVRCSGLLGTVRRRLWPLVRHRRGFQWVGDENTEVRNPMLAGRAKQNVPASAVLGSTVILLVISSTGN